MNMHFCTSGFDHSPNITFVARCIGALQSPHMADVLFNQNDNQKVHGA